MFCKEAIEKWPKKKRQNYFKGKTLAAHLHRVCKRYRVGYFLTSFAGAPNEQFGNGLSNVSAMQSWMGIGRS